ncbi:BT0820 family HAD-type phosphatase [Formosa sp. S-31]|uniref:BT0820 family HAD-type phosphatase n=1 Tax=Formosa sp. S-31 TaxID=2790949 RepID=UPI003EBA5A7F
MIFQDKLIIAVDFDGTIVEDAYPRVGKAKTFAFETLKRLQKDGHRLILWTYRCGKTLDEAVAFCKENGIEFYAVNASFPEEVFDPAKSRKINADIFIDDRNVGGFYGWGEIYQLLSNNNQSPLAEPKKKGLFSFLKGK